jgi:hypothetical protein
MNRVVLKPYSKDQFIVVNEYKYKEWIVPEGYITDGASVPRIFWSIFPPNRPLYLSAAVVHDYLTDLAQNGQITFKEADDTFRETLCELGVAKWMVWVLYASVRAYHTIKYGRDTSAKS